MQVKIKKDAKQAYIGYMVHSCRTSYSDSYAETMDRMSGRTCEVDTRHLFKTSFNVIDPDNPEMVIDVRWLFVEEVIDDIRGQKMRCGYCGETQDKGTICTKCKKTDYLENLLVQKQNI
jgi:hypothetical protein